MRVMRLIFLLLLATQIHGQVTLVMFNNSSAKAELVSQIKKVYNQNVIITDDKIPQSCYSKEYGRYRADKIIRYLSSLNKGVMVGITSVDISTTKGNIKDWGVFGLGSYSLKAAAVSTHRLKTNKDLVSTVLHELGHIYGLPHCPTNGCLMNDAKGKYFKATYTLCTSCKSKLTEYVKEIHCSTWNWPDTGRSITYQYRWAE